MKGQAIILAAVLVAAALAVPTGTAGAEAPAELYFFDKGTCTAEVMILPGEEIGEWRLPPVPEWATCWADEDGNVVTAESTFEAGPHTIKAYEGEPVRPDDPKHTDPTGAIIGVAGAFGAVAIFLGVAYIIYRRR